VTLAAIAAARERGVIRAGDEVVALLTGNGLKTPDARNFGQEGPQGPEEGANGAGGASGGTARPGEPGLAPILRPSFSAFEAWLETGA
jgi:threonine synthase